MSRPDRNQLRRALDALGSSHVAAPDPAVLDATEARLRSVHALITDAAPTPTMATRSPARRAIVGSALAGALALGALVAFAVTRDDATTTLALEVTAADHAYIILPDGSRIPATAGVTVPNGARLVVDADGSVTIDGVVIGPGETAVIIDGKVSLDNGNDPDRPNASSPNDPTTGATEPPGGDPDRDPDDPQGGGSGTTAPGATTTAAGTPTTTTAPPTTATNAPTTTIAPPAGDVVRLGGGARVIEARVRLRWDPYLAEDFAGYVVLARYDGGNPRPGNAQTVVLARFRNRDVGLFRTPFVAGMTIRVIAVDADRTMVGSTRVFAPTLEPRTDPPPTTTTSTTTAPTTTAAPPNSVAATTTSRAE